MLKVETGQKYILRMESSEFNASSKFPDKYDESQDISKYITLRVVQNNETLWNFNLIFFQKKVGKVEKVATVIRKLTTQDKLERWA